MKSTMYLSDLVFINPTVSLAKEAEYAFIDMASITPKRRYVYSNCKRVFEGGGSKFRVGDTLFARITPCLENGKIAQFRAEPGIVGFGSTEFIVFRNRENISDPGYIFYLVCSDIVRKPAEKSMSGASGRQRVDLAALSDIEVPDLSLQKQRKIAAILSNYDELIENNIRRATILEEISHLIYQEWFVHFRYPEHEKEEMVESELGMIPEKWPIRRVSEAVDIDPLTKVPKECDKPFISMENLSNSSMVINNIEFRKGNSGSKFKNGDTLLARITPCLENGKTGYVQFLPFDDETAFGSTEFIVLRSKTLCPQYVYLMARSSQFRNHAIKSMSGASGRQRVQKSCFDNLWIAHPDSTTLAKFEKIVTPLFRNIHILAQKNINLRNTRDLLLPKLISGEIDVEKLDIDTPDLTGPEGKQYEFVVARPEPIDATQMALW